MSDFNDQPQPRIPEEWRRQYERRSIEQLPGDVIKAFDRLHTQHRELNTTNRALIETQSKLRIADLKVWVLMMIVTGEGVVIGWLVKFAISHLN